MSEENSLKKTADDGESEKHQPIEKEVRAEADPASITKISPATKFENLPTVLQGLQGFLDDDPKALQALAQFSPAIAAAIDTHEQSQWARLDSVAEINWTIVSDTKKEALLQKHFPAEKLLQRLALLRPKNVDDANRRLLQAAATNDIWLLKLALRCRADINYDKHRGLSALAIASGSGHSEMVDFLLAAKAAVDAVDPDGETALMRAATYGRAAIAGRLLEAHANLSLSDQLHSETALMKAAAKGDALTTAALLAAGADVHHRKSTHGDNALMMACESGDLPTVTTLLKARADVNVFEILAGESPLTIASYQGNLAIVNALLDTRMCNIHHIRWSGDTALIVAASVGHAKVVTTLIGAHADITSANKKGITALMAAASKGHIEVIKVFLAARLNLEHLDQRDEAGNTALMLASIYGHEAIVQDLLAALADHTLANIEGDTALILAVRNHQFEIAGYLLDAGTKIHSANKMGDTALSIAKREGSQNIIILLEQHIAIQESSHSLSAELSPTSSSVTQSFFTYSGPGMFTARPTRIYTQPSPTATSKEKETSAAQPSSNNF